MSRAYEAATPGGGWRGLVSWLVEPIGLEDVVVGGQYKWAAGDRGRGGRVCRLPSSAWNSGTVPTHLVASTTPSDRCRRRGSGSR